MPETRLTSRRPSQIYRNGRGKLWVAKLHQSAGPSKCQKWNDKLNKFGWVKMTIPCANNCNKLPCVALRYHDPVANEGMAPPGSAPPGSSGAGAASSSGMA